MAIQVRRGNEADFDASKMLPGEWAVSLDTKYVRMCFAPGIVLRMATYEGFEADKAQFQAILAECRSIQEVVRRIGNEVSEKASLTIEYSNSAKESAERAKIYADNAEAVTGVHIATKDRAGLVKGGDNYIAEDGTLTLIAETTETTMPNSCEGRLLFKEIRGKTEQASTTGKNLLNPTLQTTTRNGVTCTRNSDGTYTLNGTATAKAEFTVFYNRNGAFNGKRVKGGGCPKGGSDASYKAWFTDVTVRGENDLGNGAILTPSTNELKYIIEIGNGYTCNNLLFKPMVTTDLEATYDDFEPYTGGIPSPNPSYPQEIRSVAISGIKTHDGNGNENNIAFSKSIELNKIGDVQDVITPQNVGRKFCTKELTTVQLAMNNPSNETKYMVNFGNIADMAIGNWQVGLCNMFINKGIKADNSIRFGANDNMIYCYSDNDVFATLESANAFFASNPVTVVYPLAEETTEALPIADQVALNSIETFDGTTYLEFDSPLQPEFVAEYGTSKVGGKTLEALAIARNNEIRISALETSVVNNI